MPIFPTLCISKKNRIQKSRVFPHPPVGIIITFSGFEDPGSFNGGGVGLNRTCKSCNNKKKCKQKYVFKTVDVAATSMFNKKHSRWSNGNFWGIFQPQTPCRMNMLKFKWGLRVGLSRFHSIDLWLKLWLLHFWISFFFNRAVKLGYHQVSSPPHPTPTQYRWA